MVSLLFSSLFLLFILFLLSLPLAIFFHFRYSLSPLFSIIYGIFFQIFFVILFVNIVLSLDIKIVYTNLLILIFFFLSITLSINSKFRFKKFFINLYTDLIQLKFSFLIIFSIALFLSFIPSFNLFDFSMVQRIGPDANGSLAGANYLFKGGTLNSLENSIMAEFGTNNLDQIFNLKNIYRLPSTTIQIISEFLIGSVRFNYSGLLAVLKIIFVKFSYFQISSVLNILLLILVGLITLIIFNKSKKFF